MARRVRSSPAAAKAAPPRPLDPPVSRREWIAIAAIVLLAAGLRFAYPGRMAVEHFDEGVYASNIFFTAEEGGQYPYRHLYAPPLLPFLIEWGIIFLGPESIAPFLPALILGTATVPLAWWAARCWFGPASGLAAGLLVATSDFHLLYSRTALTDVPVAFFLLLAVYLYWEAMRRESLRWAVAAGFATGLAWWTKYTGWLPLAIAVSGGAAWVLFERRDGLGFSGRAKLVAKLFAVTAVTAFVVWSPVLWGLQQYGGYAAVAENHRGYLTSDPEEWVSNAWEQGGQLAASTGWLTTVGLTVVASWAGLRSRWGWKAGVPVALAVGSLVFWATLVTGPVVPLAIAAATCLVLELVSMLRPIGDSPDESTSETSGGASRNLAAWLLIAWVGGMTVTTPFYTPYPRLVFPWLLAAWFGAATWLSRTKFSIGPVGRAELLVIALLPLPALVWVVSKDRSFGYALPHWFTRGWSMPGLQDRTGFERATERLVAEFNEMRRPGTPCVAYVYAEPALFFHLVPSIGDERTAVLPAGSMDFLRRAPRDVDAYAFYGPRAGLDLPPDGTAVNDEGAKPFFPSQVFVGDSSWRSKWDDDPLSEEWLSFFRMRHE